MPVGTVAQSLCNFLQSRATLLRLTQAPQFSSPVPAGRMCARRGWYLIPTELHIGPICAGLQAGVCYFQILHFPSEIFLQPSDVLFHLSDFLQGLRIKMCTVRVMMISHSSLPLGYRLENSPHTTWAFTVLGMDFKTRASEC